MASKDNLYKAVLRTKRKCILEETPEAKDLLADSRLLNLFTKYEREEILRERTPLARAEKLITIVEWKGEEAYRTFVQVVKEYRPSLAKKLDQEEDHQRKLQSLLVEEFEEDAGVLHFNERGPGPSYLISSISYSGRLLLGEHLNKPRDVFQNFCKAMEVPQELAERAQRSGNPTAYLIQEMSSDCNATMNRLEIALERIEKRPVYDSLIKLLTT